MVKVSFGVAFRELEGKRFYFTEIGRGRHYKPSIRLWVSKAFVKEIDEERYRIEFPVENGRIFRTEKGTLVLRPQNGWKVHYIYVECGFRGSSSIEILEPTDAEIFKFQNYHSQKGSLGVSEGMLVNVLENQIIKYSWSRSGRLYGKPSKGICVVMPDGSEKGIEDVNHDELKELESML